MFYNPDPYDTGTPKYLTAAEIYDALCELVKTEEMNISIDEFYKPGETVSEDVIAFLSGLGENAVIRKEILLQLCSSNYVHQDKAENTTVLYSTFKQMNGVWSYIGLCEKLPEDFCAVCPCSSCLQMIPEGSLDDCHACDVCIDGDISPLAPCCLLNKRGANLLKAFAPTDCQQKE